MKYSAGMLDLLEALTLPEQPVLFLKLTLQPHICMKKLQDAVNQCIALIPELALRYDKKQNCWKTPKDDVFSIVQEVNSFDFSSWDIEQNAQLCIQILHKEQQDLLCIGFSHILCDGDGATQILRLLCACYRKETVSFQNCRAPEALPVIKQKKTKAKRRKSIPVTLPSTPHPLHTCALQESISLELLKQISTPSYTVNDVLLCAYAQTLHRMTAANAMTIPCPVNLRSFLQLKPAWTIANFVGDFQVTLYGLDHRDWRELLADIHQQMQEERTRCLDLHTIRLLHPLMKHLPLTVTKAAAKAGFHSPETAYTNLGKIDVAAIYFDDCTITQLYLLGRPRSYPSFQIAASTWKDTCTLACHVTGDTLQLAHAQQILTTMCKQLKEYERQAMNTKTE